jgi:uncharacterized damage-inducible protein DinB
MLLYARETTLAAVEGLSAAELDYLQDDSGNSIGALLAHIAAVERGYQYVTFEDRPPSKDELAALEPALTLGAEGASPSRKASRALRSPARRGAVRRSNNWPRATMCGWNSRCPLLQR